MIVSVFAALAFLGIMGAGIVIFLNTPLLWVFVVLTVLVGSASPRYLWPKFSARMKCFYAEGTYVIKDHYLEIRMGRKTSVFTDIDAVYFKGPEEGAGAMYGGIISFDGTLQIKQGKKKLTIDTWNTFSVNEEVEASVSDLYEDIQKHFPELKQGYSDGGMRITGYLTK